MQPSSIPERPSRHDADAAGEAAPHRFLLRLICLAAGLAAAAAPARAQDKPAAPTAWPKVLTRALFLTNGELVKSDTPNRPADALAHVAVDLVDFGVVRIPFDYEFAAAFNNRRYPVFVDYSYTIGPAMRIGGVDVEAFLHHTSRHVHDVIRPQPVSWNLVGVRASAATARGRVALRGAADVTWYPPYARRYVDYSWDIAGAGRAAYEFSPRTAYFVAGVGRFVRCDPDIAGRDGAFGARVETGVSLGFGFGRAEAFGGFDRRIDPATFSRSVENYFVLGVRLIIRGGGGTWPFLAPLREGRPVQ